MKFAAVAVLCILLAWPLCGQQSPVSQAELDAYVSRVMKEFQVPGVGLAIVKDGKVIVAKGYGVRELAKPTPADAQTLFGIASNTKAFTATALAILVEEGRLAWDGRVIDVLPWFRLSDPYVTNELTIRDLLVHRSGLGLGAGDLLWWPPSTYDRHEIARRLRFIPLATSFRSTYAYDNVLYTVAGEVIETLSGLTWEEFVQQRVLDQVGMATSNPRHSDATNGGNVAAPHAEIDGNLKVVKPFASDNTNPAGGINSNADDMARWMIVQLDSGRIAPGKWLFSPNTTVELWTPVTPIPIGAPPPELAPLRANFRGYGLGFEIRDYRGHKIVTHTGGLPGYVSLVMMVPEIKMGVCVLTNQESGAAFNAIGLYVLDRYLSAPAIDWVASYKAIIARRTARVKDAEGSAASSRNAQSKPSLSLERYAGTYRDRWYGDIAITLEDGKLAIQFTKTPSLIGDLDHWQYDTFIARWKDRELRADAYVTFSLTPEGTVEQAKMAPASPSVDFSFDFQDLLLLPVREAEK